MTNELKQLQETDFIIDFVSNIEQRGARAILLQLKQEFPNHFQELMVQLERIKSKQVPALFKG